MTRYAALLAVLMVGIAVGQNSNFYITGCPPDGTKVTAPKMSVGKIDSGRIAAIARSGCTVWTEEQWREVQKSAKPAPIEGCGVNCNPVPPRFTGSCIDQDGKATSCGFDPLDVPAIQVATRLGCDTTGETRARGCMDHPVPVYSCKDKSRILEHDESTPPKYWCRKPQP